MTLHERIRSDIAARIMAGTLAPGERLPIEAAMMRDYGCSRMTVSKALSALAAAGLIDRRKRAGTFVARPRLHSMVLDIPDLPQEVARRGQAYAFRLVRRSVRRPIAGRAREAGLAKRGRLLAISGVHLAAGRPLAAEERLVSLDAVPEMAAADFADAPPGTWLLRHVPWTEAETRIAAIAADDAAAAALAIAPGTACLSVERETWRGDDAVTWVRQVFPGDAYDLVARFGAARG